MSQQMNFSPDIKILEGGDIPPNSVTLVYSPSCPHCHNILPQYNQLAGLSGGKFSVNAVNLMDHYHTLRAGGVEVGGVPQILIRGGSSEILEYGGPRMAESISKEALNFLSGGSKLHGGRIFGGDMLLGGGKIEAQEPISGGRRRRSRRRFYGGKSPSLSGGRRRRRRRSLRGGSTAASPEAPQAESISGGRRGASRWVRHVTSYARKHNMSLKRAMKAARASYYK
jgi:hypothetical protein